MYYSMHVKIKGQPGGISFLLPPLYGFQELTPGHQTGTAPLPAEPSHWPNQHFHNNKAIPCLRRLLAECKLCLLHYDPTHMC